MGTSLTLARPKTSPPAAHVAAQHWAWCAPFLATDRMRLSRDGGRTYPRATERAITHQLPDQPAAVKVYDRGLTRVLVADFDTSRGDAATVEREAQDLIELVARCGGRTITDRSPSGGRHVYVPLTTPTPWALTRRIALALEQRYTTFDKMPMVGQTDGLIRPPGSPHPAGGWQELLNTREETISALSSRTSPPAFVKLCKAVGIDPDAPASAASATGSDWREAMNAPALHGRRRRRLSPEWELMATTGVRPSTWQSDSEARLALLRACARHGWTFTDVVSRFESGTWRGLRELYERYQPQHLRKAIARDWLKALCPEPLNDPGKTPARKIDTREPLTHPHLPRQETAGDPYALIRDWWTVLREVEKVRWPGRGGLSIRRVLRAIGAAAQMKGSTVVAFGVRSLAEGSGLDHSTVAKVLAELREEDAPFIIRVEQASGLEADIYELQVPDIHHELTRVRWRPGRIESIHPLFRLLGGAGFLVWEVMASAGDEPVTSFDVAAEAGVSLRAAQASLVELGGLGLVERHGSGWVAVGSLEVAAEQTGAAEVHLQVVVQHRRDREAWRGLMQLMAGLWQWWTEEPPEPDPGLLEAEHLLETELGAAVA